MNIGANFIKEGGTSTQLRMRMAKSVRIEYGLNSNLQLNDISWVIKLDLLKMQNLCNTYKIQTLKTKIELIWAGFTKNVKRNMEI